MYVEITWWSKTPKNICFYSTIEQLFINKWEKWHFFDKREMINFIVLHKDTFKTNCTLYVSCIFLMNNFDLVYNIHHFNNKVMPWDVVAKTTEWTWTSALSTSKLGRTKSDSFYWSKLFWIRYLIHSNCCLLITLKV